jgi:hypothetical protein
MLFTQLDTKVPLIIRPRFYRTIDAQLCYLLLHDFYLIIHTPEMQKQYRIVLLRVNFY